MLCPKCNSELNYKELVDKCNRRYNNKYVSNVRMIYSCNECNYFSLHFKKLITEVNI